MRRAVPRVVSYAGSKSSRFVVEGLRVNGKRTRKFFPTRRAAKAWLRKTLARMRTEGEAAITMPEAVRVEAALCAAKLAPFGKTISDATEHYLEHLAAVERTCAVSQLVDEFVAAKEQDGASERYLKDIRLRLKRFADDYGASKVAEITTQAVDDWLRSLELSAQSRNNYRTVLGTLFSFALVRNYARTNPVERTAKAKVVRGAPAILTPAQMLALLENSPRDFIPYLAIGGFAGLRSAEIERLEWSEIDVPRRLIHVKAEKAKSAQRRLVIITDNLAAWLAPLAQRSGPVADRDRARVARAKLVAQTKMGEWPDNALRHSFASYHLAHHKNAAALSAELGHTSPKMLFAHYRELVAPDVAMQWWSIAPPADYANIVAFEQRAASS